MNYLLKEDQMILKRVASMNLKPPTAYTIMGKAFWAEMATELALKYPHKPRSALALYRHYRDLEAIRKEAQRQQKAFRLRKENEVKT